MPCRIAAPLMRADPCVQVAPRVMGRLEGVAMAVCVTGVGRVVGSIVGRRGRKALEVQPS